jgi:LacI family transcriptional regulator
MQARSQNITIHEVAAEAGVSIKTVSRVLRHEHDVSDATRARVQETIARLNYVPHSSARMMASTTSNVIGLVVVEAAQVPYEYRMRLQMGALDACRESGFGLRMEVVAINDPQAGERLVQQVRQREMGGYVLASRSALVPGLCGALDEAGVKYVSLVGYPAPGGVFAVSADDRAAMRVITRLVLEAGHRRIGFLRGNQGLLDAEERYQGFMDAMMEAGVPVNPAMVVPGVFDFESGRRGAAQLLEMAEPPTAIIASSDDMAAGVISRAHECGLRLPRDLSVTGFDDVNIAHKLWPPLTTVHRPIEKMSEVATRQLISVLKPVRSGKQPSPVHNVQVHCEIVSRASVVPPGGTAIDPVSSLHLLSES